jgi:hypothetical protein
MTPPIDEGAKDAAIAEIGCSRLNPGEIESQELFEL